MKFINKHKLLIIGAAIGAGAGYAYYYFIGCTDGTCAITSNPINISIYGTIMGALIGSSAKDAITKKQKTSNK
jgi:hypothetical protein